MAEFEVTHHERPTRVYRVASQQPTVRKAFGGGFLAEHVLDENQEALEGMPVMQLASGGRVELQFVHELQVASGVWRVRQKRVAQSSSSGVTVGSRWRIREEARQVFGTAVIQAGAIAVVDEICDAVRVGGVNALIRGTFLDTGSPPLRLQCLLADWENHFESAEG